MKNLNILTKLQLSIIATLLIIAISLILSQSANPDSILLFPLKRAQEKAFLNLKTEPSQRLDYYSNLLDIRLEELKNLVNNKSYDPVLNSSLRYSTLAGEMTDLILAANLKEKVRPVSDQFQVHKKVLNEIYVIYPKNTDNLEYKYIEDDMNYLDIYLDKLSAIK